MGEDRRRPTLQYTDLLRGAVRGGVDDLMRHADQLERAQTTEEERRAELEARLAVSRHDRPIIPVREWVRNPYFVGALAADEGGGLYPVLKEVLEEIFDGRGGLGYFEVVAGGAIGYGKTSGLMKAAYLRVLYELSCYAVPQHAFRKMMENDAIVLVNFNTTEKKARDTLYASTRREMESIGYFKEHFLPQANVLNEMRLPKSITARPGVATDTGAVSENLAFACLDEANKYVLVEDSERTRARGETYDVAARLHSACFNRMRSRFLLPGGEMPRVCKLFSGSSAEYPDDFIERRCEQIRAGKVEHAALVVRFAEWETKPKSYYVRGFVPVAVSPEGGAEVLDGDGAGPRRVELEGRGWSVHDVPREHVPSFRENPEMSVRELLGIATKAIEPFLRRREAIQAAVDARAAACASLGVGPDFTKHPFTSEETTLRDGAQFIRDRLIARDDADPDGRWRPRVSPGAVRFAHFDLSENKCGTGFVVGHVLDVRPIQRIKRLEDGTPEPSSEPAPWIWVDLSLRIVAPRDEVVDYAACRGLVHELAGMGFRFGRVTYDQWQSGDSRQRMEEHGYQVDLVSMDRDQGPYVTLRRAIYEGRLLLYDYGPLREELQTVESVRGKVVPAKGKSKDVSDALAAVVYACETWGMQGYQWSSSDARLALAPRLVSGLPPRAGADPAREVQGAPALWSGGPAGRAPKPPPDIFTRARGGRR